MQRLSAALARRFDRRPGPGPRCGCAAELGGRGTERGLDALLRLRRLHALEERVELGVELVQALPPGVHQRLELLVGHQHRLGRIVARDRDRAPAGLLEDGAELVLQAGGGDTGDIDQLAEAVAESERAHGGTSNLAIIAILAVLVTQSAAGCEIIAALQEIGGDLVSTWASTQRRACRGPEHLVNPSGNP